MFGQPFLAAFCASVEKRLQRLTFASKVSGTAPVTNSSDVS
jgi:hypothetical protein